MDFHPITVAYGDGIGPEIMEAVLSILREAKANIAIETIEIGEKEYRMGNASGIPATAWESLRRTKVLLKAPITTPQGGGYKSLNVTLRKTLGLYANVRPCVCYHPFVKTAHPGMDLVIVRENEEDLYTGIEYQSTPDAVHCIKLITQSGSERIIRYAFDYAAAHDRSKVTCMSKDHIMKMTDGMFHRTFDRIGAEYPHIEKEHIIVDRGAARIATYPERFDVVVTENLYGGILSDIAAEVLGSVGLAGSSNIGEYFAVFGTIHGSAPDIAGRDIANPSGLLHGALMMLAHIGQPDVATLIHNAWLATLESGIHTADIHNASSTYKAGTQEFAQAVIAHLGQRPQSLKPAHYQTDAVKRAIPAKSSPPPSAGRELIGADIFVYWTGEADALANLLKGLSGDVLKLHSISSRGLKLWPDYAPGMNVTDQFNCRFKKTGASLALADIAILLSRLAENSIDFLKTEHLYAYDGKEGYSLGQGE